MLVMVDERQLVIVGYQKGFESEGMAIAGFRPSDFLAWIENAPAHEVAAIEAFLLGDGQQRVACARAVALRSRAPVIALSDSTSLETTLSLFAEGVDDVVRKPIHVREIVARVGAIRRRSAEHARAVVAMAEPTETLNVFFDGRDPEIAGVALNLPRRERRILEFLISNRGRRVTKTQIFNAIYGIFDEDVEENVVESHVSKLRKKLRQRLGYDPIDSKRFLGYCIDLDARRDVATTQSPIRQAA
jgi:DNA-binding response OmpR family regulator